MMDSEWNLVTTRMLYKSLKERCRTLRVPWFDEGWDGWEDDKQDPWFTNDGGTSQ